MDTRQAGNNQYLSVMGESHGKDPATMEMRSVYNISEVMPQERKALPLVPKNEEKELEGRTGSQGSLD